MESFDDNSFEYNADGIRIKKNETEYELDGTTILSETKDGKTLRYYYANSGIVGFIYNSVEYYYQKNIQGDITAIYRENGTLVGEYSYDAWGNCTVTTDVDDIATLNPFRYRGYYFDAETGLYYLNTRYYAPDMGRFINPDSTDYLDPRTVNGLNLYAYCGNNPVNYFDPSGHALVSILIAMAIGFGIGFAVGGAFEIGKQIYANGWNPEEWSWRQIGLSALGGGVAGAISAFPIGGSGFLSYMLTFAVGGVASVFGGLISGSIDSLGSAALAFGIGGIANVVGRGMSDIIKNFKVSRQISTISSRAQDIANMSLKNKSLTIWRMQGLDNFSRNAYKSWGYNQIFNLLMTEATNQLNILKIKNLTRYLVYSSIISGLGSGWF